MCVRTHTLITFFCCFRPEITHLFITSLSTRVLSTTTIWSGIFTFTDINPSIRRERMVAHWPPCPSGGYNNMSVEFSLVWSPNENISGSSVFPYVFSFSKNSNDSVHIVDGNRQIKSLQKQKSCKSNNAQINQYYVCMYVCMDGVWPLYL